MYFNKPVNKINNHNEQQMVPCTSVHQKQEEIFYFTRTFVCLLEQKKYKNKFCCFVSLENCLAYCNVCVRQKYLNNSAFMVRRLFVGWLFTKKKYLNFGICQRCSFGVIETSRVESSWAELCCVVVPVYFSYIFFNTQQFYFHFIFFSFFFVCLLCIQCKSK